MSSVDQKIRKSQQAAKIRRRYEPVDATDFIAVSRGCSGVRRKRRGDILVPNHSLNHKTEARAHTDTLKLTLFCREPVWCNTMVGLLKKALNHKERAYGCRFHVLGTDKTRGPLLAGRKMDCHRITIQDPTFDDLLAVSQMPILREAPRIDRLDVAIDFWGGDASDRRKLQRALSLTYSPRYHDLSGWGVARQVFSHRAQTAYLPAVPGWADTPSSRGDRFHPLARVDGDVSNYFGAVTCGLETIIYHKVLNADKSRLPESEQRVRVEVRLWKKKLRELLGIWTLDDLLSFKPSGFAGFFKFEVPIVPKRRPECAISRKQLDLRMRYVSAGVYAYRECYRPKEFQVDDETIIRRRERKVTDDYYPFIYRCNNALQAWSRKWREVGIDVKDF